MDAQALARLKKEARKKLLLLGLAAISAILASAYILLWRGAYDFLIEETFNGNKVVVRAGANSIGLFLDSVGKSLATISKDSAILSFGSGAQATLDIFRDEWSAFPVPIALIDTSGVIVFGSNTTGQSSVGAKLDGRDYFLWSKTAKKGEYRIFPPITSMAGMTEGMEVIPIASPLIDSGSTYRGVVVAVATIGKIAEKFILPLRVIEDSSVYLVDAGGLTIYSSDHKSPGVNFLTEIENAGFLGSKKTAEIIGEKLVENKEGTLDIQLPNSKTGGLERHLITYSPVNIGENHWMLIVSVPANSALVFIVPFYFKGLIFVSIMVLILILVSVRASKLFGYIEATEVEHEYHKKDKNFSR